MNYRVHYQTSEIIFADKASHGHSEKVKVHEICFIERGVQLFALQLHCNDTQNQNKNE